MILTRSGNVAWLSPLSTDIYGPRSTIHAKWVSPTTIDSPSMKLCLANVGGCGPTMWPVVSESAGVYEMSVPVSDFTSNGECYLQMEDNYGETVRSPVFSLSPTGAAEPVVGPQPQAQAPFLPIMTPSSYTPPLLYPTLVQSAQPSTTTSPESNNLLTAKSPPPPTVAYAVPLSAVAAVVVVAGVLFLKRRRRSKDPDVKRPSRSSTLSSYKSSSSEVGHALRVLTRHHGHRNAPTPLFMPPDDGYQRKSLPYPRWDPPREEQPRLPPITTGSFMSNGPDHITNDILADYMLPSPTLPSSTSMPRCLLPAHVHESHPMAKDDNRNPLGPSDRPRDVEGLYDRVERKLDMYRRS
ncbi:hypothetical protein FB45DRAFT_454721 [Roridomyces roridus]|uniref:Uncharacterized protein n=1 Tax=Roridomyces roridus TaxID=1738132 RepID=A0AAD7FST2_9AGAR|nr:hypothetical protein FB45DRAFT_454721 [Roridomyces roridus]